MSDIEKRGYSMGIVVKSFDIGQGDFFLIKISNSKGKYFNLLVDCGKTGMFGDLKTALNNQRLNGIVVTHVDNDHITGVIDLVENHFNDLDKTFIIYNKYDETLITYDKGKKLYEEIKNKLSQNLLIKSYARDYSRENKVIERRKKTDELSVHILSKQQRSLMNTERLEKDNVYITLLSPKINILKRFMRNWKNVSNGIKKESATLKNQSSIIIMIEFNDKRLLMLGDGPSNAAYDALSEIKGIKKIDYIKLSHHGAKNSNKGIEKFCDTYSCETFGVTIKENQDNERNHPNRDLLISLFDKGCSIYTSTDFKCSDPNDCIKKVKKIETEIIL